MLLLTALLVQCDWSTVPVQQDTLVVDAFLETGQPLSPIRLRHTRPLGGGAGDSSDAASGAEVTVTVDGQTVGYEEGESGVYNPRAKGVIIPARVPWRLTIRRNGETARASGTTPPPIALEEVCVDVPASPSRAVQVDSLRRDSLDIPTDQGYIYPIDVALRWDGLASTSVVDTTQWVRAQLRPDASSFPSEVVRFFLEPADLRREDRYRRDADDRTWQGVYAVPVEGPQSEVPTHALTATLVRGDSAFAAFARSRTDPDRREPISNVDGALGVALSVAVDSLRIDSLSTAGMERCTAVP